MIFTKVNRILYGSVVIRLIVDFPWFAEQDVLARFTVRNSNAGLTQQRLSAEQRHIFWITSPHWGTVGIDESWVVFREIFRGRVFLGLEEDECWSRVFFLWWGKGWVCGVVGSKHRLGEHFGEGLTNFYYKFWFWICINVDGCNLLKKYMIKW